jgi:uncharacterized protein YciI
MKTFLIIYRPGPAWLGGLPVSRQPLQEHGQYILGLYREGKLRFGGPFEDDAGGAVVVEVADPHEARAIADNDPAVMNGVFVYELHPWKLLPWQEYVNAGR